MVRAKLVLYLFLIIFISKLSTAQDTPIIKKGLISAFATLSPSYMLSEKQSEFYLHGNLEYFVEDKISVVGEGFWRLGNASGAISEYQYNHNLFFGAAKHFTSNSNDFFIGLEPGVSISKLALNPNELSNSHSGVNPVFSATLGYNLFFYKYFHFFLQSKFITGTHNQDQRKDLTEFRFSAGLGFNI